MAEEASNTAAQPVKRHRIRKFFKYLCIFLLAILLSACGALFWLTQTGSGQAWAVKTVNDLLARPADAKGLSFRITSLSGSIPFDFQFGLESEDKHGRWLAAPSNHIVWNWRELPGCIHISQLRLDDIDIERLPDLPPKEESDTPAKPLTVSDVRELIKSAGDFLAEKHWWFPDIRLDDVAAGAILPAGLLEDKERLAANIGLVFSFADSRISAGARLSAQDSAGGRIALSQLAFAAAAVNLALSVEPQDGGLAADCQLESDITGLALAIKDLPPDFLGENVQLGLNARARASDERVAISLDGPGLAAGHLNFSVVGSWESESGWQAGKIAGPAACKVKLDLVPPGDAKDSPLKALRAPLELAIDLNGDLPVLDLDLNLDCAAIEESGHTVIDTRLGLTGKKITVPLGSSLQELLEQEQHLNFNFATHVDNQPANISALVFFQNFGAGSVNDGWRVGLRNLSLDAFGLAGTGNVAALLGASPHPAIDGSVKLAIRNWGAVEKIVPDTKFTGQVDFDVALKSGLEASLAEPAQAFSGKVEIPGEVLKQNAQVSLVMPKFAMRPAKGKPVELANIRLAGNVEDLFAKPAFDAKVEAGAIQAAGLRLAAQVSASGPFSGPLEAVISSSGDISSKIAASWQPGQVALKNLDVSADLSSFIKGGKSRKMLAGLHAVKPAQFFYGDQGYRIDGLDLRLTPGGRLTANGGLAPDKLNLNLNLQDLDFKSFRNIVPDLPSGSVQAAVNLQGTPARPAGNFRVGLNDIAFPKSPLAPASLTLIGEVINRPGGGALKTRLEINPATVKALGGTAAEIAATVPLVFGKDGVPGLDMGGPLQAKVVWNGALGPIWNLLPLSGRRLNGRVDIDASASGTLAKPAIRGKASIGNARYEDLLLGILLSDINLKLDLADSGRPVKPSGSAIDSLPGAFRLALNLSDGRGGTVAATGGGRLDGENLDIKAKITNLRPLRRRDIFVQLSGNAQVSGSAWNPLVEGEIIVDKGEVLLNNLAMTASVTTLDITTEAQLKAQQNAPPAKSDSAMGGKLNVRVRMLPRFSVEGRGLASLWQCNLLIAGPLDNPQVTGSINSVRGNFDFLGKVFALTRGRVFFGGGSLSNPLVDIELTYDTPDLTAHIMVDGPANKIRLTMTSDPTMPRDEIISRVLFGRSVNDLSRMEALQLAGAVAQLAGFGGGAGPLGSVKKALGVDVLRIGTANTGSQNQTSDDTGGGTTLEMGKYINDYTYMGVQQGFKADSTAFIIEIELSNNASLELRTEQSNTWGGIKWRKNY